MASTASPTQRSRDRRAGHWTELFSNEKSFSHPWVGSPLGNRLGLHKARVRLAEGCARVRRLQAGSAEPAQAARLRRDGLLVIENVLPPGLFEAARDEFNALMAEHARRVPAPRPTRKGFGRPLPNDGGFDRFDGGSLNRFVELQSCATLRRAFGEDGPLARPLRALTGTHTGFDRYLGYLLVHGDEAVLPDLQRQVHCDTFHETFKLWYFFDAVTLADGPLMYSPGSHCSTPARLRWEQHMAVQRRSGSSAFRIGAGDLAALGWAVPTPVLTPPNALVLADTRGFHCRSVAPAGTQRPCLYANLRPRAFSLRVD